MDREEVKMEFQAALTHFLNLARQGSSGAASGGEQRAFRLIQAIASDVPGIDSMAVEGLKHFITIASCQPGTAQDLLDFTLRRKGGRGG